MAPTTNNLASAVRPGKFNTGSGDRKTVFSQDHVQLKPTHGFKIELS